MAMKRRETNQRATVVTARRSYTEGQYRSLSPNSFTEIKLSASCIGGSYKMMAQVSPALKQAVERNKPTMRLQSTLQASPC
jgi:hypothetical protein